MTGYVGLTVPRTTVSEICIGIVSSSGIGPIPFERHHLRAFAQRIAVVGALTDDVDCLPCRKPDIECEEHRRCRPRRIDVPDQPVRIAQAVGPDLLSRALERRKRIVVGDPIRPFSLTVLVAVCSRRSGTMRRILPTSVSSRCGFIRRLSLLLAGASVAGSDVHDPPVGIAAVERSD